VASVGVSTSFGADPAQLSVTGKPRAVNNAYGGLAVISGIAAACPDEGVVCTGTGTITGPGAKKSALLGSGPILVSPGISQDVTVTLSKRGLKSLAERGKLKVAISVSLTGPDGQLVTASNGGTIKRLKKKG
jgi:ABC-type taurine transport system ATPase subunit